MSTAHRPRRTGGHPGERRPAALDEVGRLDAKQLGQYAPFHASAPISCGDWATGESRVRADAKFAQLSAYFDGCRIKRNASEYDFAGGVTNTDADRLLKAVRQFAADAEAWIKVNRPPLA